MTVTAQTPITSATGNGATVNFPYSFYIGAEGDLVVSVDSVIKTLNVDYTIAGEGQQAGGTVTFTVAPANGAKILLYRSTLLKRDTDYQIAGAFAAPTVNLDFDRVWLALQEQNSIVIERAIRTPLGEVLSSLPAAASRANRTMGFDSSGNPTVLTPTAGDAASVLTDLANSSDTSKGDALIATRRSEAGSIATTLHAANQIGRLYNVKIDAGAVGDGTTDDTAKVHIARDAVGVNGVVYFPAPGTYIVAGLAANVAGQTWIVEKGAKLKLKDASILNVIVVSANDFSFIGEIDGNRANASGGGMVSITAGVLRPSFDVKISEWTSYAIYAPNVTQLKVRGSFSGGNNMAIFNTMSSDTADRQGPDIDVTIDLSAEAASFANPAMSIRGQGATYRYLNANIRAKVRMPVGATNSSAICCEVWTVRNARIDVQSYGGSMNLSLFEVERATGLLTGKAFSHYGIEYGGGCLDCAFYGTVDGTNDAGSNISLYPVAVQGSGLNKRCGWHGVARGAGGTRVINYSNGENCDFSGQFFCGAATYVINDQSQGKFSLRGRFYAETAGQYIAILSNSAGHVEISGYAEGFANGGVLLSANSAITIDNVSMTVNFRNSAGGGYVQSLSGGAALGEYVTAKGSSGQYIGGSQFRADVINLKRAIYEVEGTGTPEGSLAAGVGSRYRRADGGAGTSLYVKESGTGNTGWVGK
jgi:hypothetical protein